MSDIEYPKKATLRKLRYIEPGSDSPWKEILGKSPAGNLRPQWYSQLEMPKILELIAKHCKIWFPPEVAKSIAKVSLAASTEKASEAEARAIQALLARKTLGSRAATVQETLYFVTLQFIFLDSGGKVVARKSLRLYTNKTSGAKAKAVFGLAHFKGARAEMLLSESSKVNSTCFRGESSRVVALVALLLTRLFASRTSCSDAGLLASFKAFKSHGSCISRCVLDVSGYGYGFYGLGLYGK